MNKTKTERLEVKLEEKYRETDKLKDTGLSFGKCWGCLGVNPSVNAEFDKPIEDGQKDYFN